MVEQASGWTEVFKWLGFVGAGVASFRAYWKSRNINHSDRISRVERQNQELRRVINEAVGNIQDLASAVDIDRGDSHRRFQRVEADIRTVRRETRDKLLEIAETLREQEHRATGEQAQPRA